VLETQQMREVVCFESFEVDVCAGEVRKHGHRIRLQDQPFRILQILLAHPGEVVAREELQRQIWPSDTFVDFERGLNNAVKRLREALGDSADSPRYVETVPKRGYRFIAAVEARNGNSQATAEVHVSVVPHVVGPKLRFRVIVFGVAAVALAGALFLGTNFRGWRSRLLLILDPPVIQSLAVLPLQNLSGDPSQEYFADGMTDGLITELSQIGSVRVISRTSIMRYKRTNKPLPEIARELNVDGIIEGTVQRSGDRVRITAQLLYAPSERHLWADIYERDLKDVFSLEQDVTREITRQIQVRLVPQARSLPAQPRAVNVKALEAYLQGKHHLDRVGQGFADEENKNAAEHFQQAIDADPNFVQAYIGLANAHEGLLLPSSEDAAVIENVRKKIRDLAPGSSIAAMFLADEKADNWDWKGAEAEYRKAIALDPNNVEAHKHFARFLDDLARLDEGWKEWQAAQELDPNPDRLPSALDLPAALSLRGKCDQALGLILRVLDGSPNDGQTHNLLSLCYEQTGRYREEIEELGKVSALYGHPEIETLLNHAYAANGYEGALRQWARELEHLQAMKQIYFPGYLAAVYGELGDKERAFYWLEEAYKFRFSRGLGTGLIHGLKIDPDLKLIRDDPRYFDLLRRVGLPQ
jgi:TolB-like protein/DNA-binding winged helix-turn-helix (wHTH) protein